MANTVTIDSHPETTFVGSYRKARASVSEDTYSRFFRYESTNIIPASADVVMR